MINFNAGYTAAFYGMTLDPVAWAEGERFELISGSISRTNAELRQSAQITVRDFDDTNETWCRIYMDAKQDENVSHVPLFTGLISVPEHDIDGHVVTRPLECYSVLEPMQDIKLTRGWYMPAGTNGSEAVKMMLESTPAPYRITDTDSYLDDYIVAENDESNLTMMQKIIDALGWMMWIEGDGTVVVGPAPTEPAARYSDGGADVVERSLKVRHDWFGCPNVFTASTGAVAATARDEDPKSPFSTVSRGREIQKTESDVKLADSESIASYAERRLKEEQQFAEEATYTRRFDPDVNVGSVIALNYPEIQGEFRVTQQTIGLTYAAETQEVVTK